MYFPDIVVEGLGEATEISFMTVGLRNDDLTRDLTNMKHDFWTFDRDIR
jgi:hypothetical protein